MSYSETKSGLMMRYFEQEDILHLAIASVRVCQSLSDKLQPIHLFRYDAFHK